MIHETEYCLQKIAFEAFRFWTVVPLVIFMKFHLYVGSLKNIFTDWSYIIRDIGKISKILLIVIQKNMAVPIGMQIFFC